MVEIPNFRKRWEILLAQAQIYEFRVLLEEHDGIILKEMLPLLGNRYWIICNPNVQTKLIAKLKFDLIEIEPYGIDIQFTDC